MNASGEILIYQSAGGVVKIEVRLEDETVWLTQAQMGQLFGKGRTTITGHIQNIFAEGELLEEVVCRDFRHTTQHGAMAGKTQEVATRFYNLDVIISVGYRVKSPQGTQFRIWATQRLKEYLIKGFTLNDERFKTGNSMNYFNELQERIREIRLSERFFYQKIKDIYTTSIDYDPKDERTVTFFKIIQNKLLWAISQQTAAELIYRRVDAALPLLGMQSYDKKNTIAVKKHDAGIAKNYLRWCWAVGYRGGKSKRRYRRCLPGSRSAAEPAIGHLRSDHRMYRCWPKGAHGDALHAVLCAVGCNLSWLQRAIVSLGLKVVFLRLFGLMGITFLCRLRLHHDPKTKIFIC